jgi:parallel beta-helix repeat protein
MRIPPFVIRFFTVVAAALILAWSVSAAGTLSVSPTSINLQASAGTTVPSQTVTIRNDGKGALRWSITPPAASWVNVSPTSGVNTGTVTVSFPSPFSAGTYSTSFTVTDGVSPVVVSVNVVISSTTPPPPSPSPDGTMVPTTASQIVDSSGAVWTIGSNLAILRNGTSAAGGQGTKIYWKNSTIYVFGTDNNWWQWTGSGWTNIGPTQPGTTPPPPSPSPDGTMVPTTASQIVDSSGAVWTIASNLAILRNGTQAAGGYGSKIYWKNSTIYVFGTDSNWWQWTGSGWLNVGPTQPGGGSVPPPTGVGPQSTITCPAGAVNVFPGASIQNAVNLNGGSTTFCLKSGVHYLSGGITPKTGNTFIGEYGAILDGTGWTTTDHNDGAFRTLKVDVDNVTISNLVIRNMPQRAIAAYYTSIYASFSDHWTIEYNEIASNGDAGVHFVPYSVVRNNYIHHNGFAGYFGDPAEYSTIENNEIAYNGPNQKVGESANVTFRNNFVHHNMGMGIWYDWDNTGGLVEGNRVEDNSASGIQFEVSSDGIVRNNIVRRSAQTGIYISTSKNMQVYNNTLENNFRGIQYFINCAAIGQGKIGFDLVNVSSYDNSITVGTESGAWANFLSYSGDCTLTQLAPYLNGSKNLTFSHNTYRVPSLANWYWLWGPDMKYWNQWQAIPQDATGTATQYQ